MAVVDDEGGAQRFDQRRLCRGMVAEHQGAHTGTREVRTEHEELPALPAPSSSGKSEIAHPREVAIEEGDKRLGLGCCDEGHVVAEMSRECGGLRGGRPSCG